MWQEKLLDWYGKHKRDLPWRKTRDPYKIWVSEIMLQQTTVATVIPYYETFLKRFPDLRSLVRAEEDDVLRHWAGLGYYSRARNLQKAARMAGRDLPRTVEGLLKLPGVGRYTAGAIASIAYDLPAPILDGNVMRVLSRLFLMTEDPKSVAGQKVFWARAEEVLPKRGRSGDFNQALMELGATVCTPLSPRCGECPVSGECRAKKEGAPESFPKTRKPPATVSVAMTAALIYRRGRLLMIRRPDTGLLRRMWEVPMVAGNASDLSARWALVVEKSFAPVRHSVLNRRLVITPVLARLKGPWQGPEETCWVKPDDVFTRPSSSMIRKILKASSRSLS